DTTVTSLGLDGRTFLGLAVGRTPFDAKLVQNNTMPLRVVRPVSGLRRTVELPAVGVSVPKGQNLYLMATAIHATSVLMGSRLPAALVLDTHRALRPAVRSATGGCPAVRGAASGPVVRPGPGVPRALAGGAAPAQLERADGVDHDRRLLEA